MPLSNDVPLSPDARAPSAHAASAQAPPESLFVSARDGLRLHVRRHGPALPRRVPVICLPGLSRNAEDFEDLGATLAALGRTVYSLDYRGRGLSDHDPDWRNYDLRVELDDVFSVMAALGPAEAVFVGTSRGGMIVATMAAVRPTALRGVVLNDIGPEIDGRGLARIRGYVGRLPVPRDLQEGASILKRLGDAQFTAFTDEDWLGAAKRTWGAKDGRLVPKYDLNLTRSLDALDLDKPLPQFWQQFAALSHVPVLVLRGANSDLLSAATAIEMTNRHPRCRMIEVQGQGHAPHLAGEKLLGAIAQFIETCG